MARGPSRVAKPLQTTNTVQLEAEDRRWVLTDSQDVGLEAAII